MSGRRIGAGYRASARNTGSRQHQRRPDSCCHISHIAHIDDATDIVTRVGDPRVLANDEQVNAFVTHRYVTETYPL